MRRYVIERCWFAPDEFNANPHSKVVAHTTLFSNAIAWLEASSPNGDEGEVMRLYAEDGDEFGWDRGDGFLEFDGREVIDYGFDHRATLR